MIHFFKKIIHPLLFFCTKNQDRFNHDLHFIRYPILTKERLKLIREYCRVHYGSESYYLKQPTSIVIHYTAKSDLESSLKYFKPAHLPSGRVYLIQHGAVNVGVHFVVDKDGSTYSLLPEKIMGRHTIGFNHIAFAIENVAHNASELTDAQIDANALLIAYLKNRYPTIGYLFGHHEYMNASLSHFIHYKRSASYRPSVKIDPGDKFMRKLRVLLNDKYKIELQR